MLNFINLHQTASFAKLQALRPFNPVNLSVKRIQAFQHELAAGLHYSWAACPVTNAVIDVLAELAHEQQLLEKYEALLNGTVMNTGEKRMVLHHLTRGTTAAPVMQDGKSHMDFYQKQCSRMRAFSHAVRNGTECGVTGKPFTDIVQIGIGGSDLGPRALYFALREWARREGINTLNAHFISNVDPDDAAAVIARINPEQTLFILVSKSGTTQETLTNEAFIQKHVSDTLSPQQVQQHTIAITSKTSPMQHGYRQAFFIDDYIGGRYSSTSMVGGGVLSLAFGYETFQHLLSGAHKADEAARNTTIRKNPTLLDALIGIYERNVMGYNTTAILPYSQALHRFPAHLQQLDMESNGKSVNRNGERIPYHTGPIVFGEPGTNGQHSFYQLLHQGTDIIPLQFIGFLQSQSTQDAVFDGSTSQEKLNANLAAQITAFAMGKTHANTNKYFAGGRPSSLLVAPRLLPETLGALLAHYENKIMFQGFAWNINSFDQEGVQLGKLLTNELLSGSPSAELQAYADMLRIQK